MEMKSVVFWMNEGDIDPIDWPPERGLPAITGGLRAPGALPEVVIAIARWQGGSFDMESLDAEVAVAEENGPFGLRIQGLDERGEAAVAEILTRYQRLAPRRNAASTEAWFPRALAVHRAMHDLSKPLVRADFDHALDTWQWAVRLDPAASAAVQLAALFHDIERLQTEADRRVEHLAPDYQAFKDAHARAGAKAARMALAHAGVPAETARRAASLVEAHERPSDDPELALLNDADALSFFSLNSWGFLGYFGLLHTARKIDYTLRRMGPAARARLFPVRYHPAVERLVRGALAQAPDRGPDPT